MRVLVTGGAGYIGSVVNELLVSAGHEVTVLDDLSKGHADAVIAGVPLIEGDIGDLALVSRTIRENKIEAVVHMAARSLVGESMVDPAKYYQTNMMGGLSLLSAMRAEGARYIVFSSTAAVYGAPEKQPIEESWPVSPTNPYGETKLGFERALEWYDRAYGFRYTSLRYFNAAGATERSGERHDPETHLIPIVLDVALREHGEVVVFGDDYPTKDGTCVRDYIHVTDLARAHVLALEALAGGKPSAIYNLGCGGEGYTVREVVEVAQALTGRRIPLRVGARRPGDPAVLVASSERIKRELGFRPDLSDLAQIIDSAWRFLKARQGLKEAV